MQQAILDLVHENPESTILIHEVNPRKVVRVDVGEYENVIDIQKGDVLSDVGIDEDEKSKRKRRKDMKLHLTHNGVTGINQVYTISRVDE